MGFRCRLAFSHLPVLIEPVVDLGLGVNGVTEVGGSGGGDPELLLVSAEEVVDQLLVLSLVVLLDDAELSGSSTYKNGGLGITPSKK